MTTRRTVPLIAVAALIALGAAACSSSVDGHATPPTPGAAGAASTPDLPPVAAGAATPGASNGLATAASTAVAPSAPSAGPSRTVIPAPAAPLRTVTTTPTDGRSFVVQVWAQRRDASCADHAYGAPMIAFLRAHPCLGLDRELATTRVGGREVGMSIVTTGFRGTMNDPYATLEHFRALIVKDGTGSIDDLLREGYRLPSGPTSVPTPDAFNALGQDNGISVYDVWYLQGPTPDNDKALVAMTQDIFLQV